MSAQHTPGPWVQHPSYPWIIKTDYRPIADVEDGLTVCNTAGHENSGFFPTPGEGRANARLIAAAPELLAALQNLADRVYAEGSAYCAEEVEEARAAIAKATGVAS